MFVEFVVTKMKAKFEAAKNSRISLIF